MSGATSTSVCAVAAPGIGEWATAALAGCFMRVGDTVVVRPHDAEVAWPLGWQHDTEVVLRVCGHGHGRRAAVRPPRSSLDADVTHAPDFDLDEAHRHFAAHCFNSAWDLIEKPDRTPEEARAMVALGHASLY